ncbi:MAG: hypothetical protein K9L32_12175 [Chromatiaceae bacterium]|nr:hypothetical protein [Chromatiaceae bacterium]MCF8004929.1 hypothetical protein [Chromatiaceae bacterium]MCF8017526.1 hypothetical protein [Chromatiaceae bacterium]
MSNLRDALHQRIERDHLSEQRLAALDALQAKTERPLTTPTLAPASQGQP